MKKLKLPYILVIFITIQLISFSAEAAKPSLGIIKKVLKKMGGGGENTLSSKVLYKDVEVIGVEPSWSQENNYNNYPFNLLTTIVVAEYDINPTNGSPRNYSINEYFGNSLNNKNSILKIAKDQNPIIKALISLNYSNDYGISRSKQSHYNKFLTNSQTKKTVINRLNGYLDTLKNEFKYDENRCGILVDFKGLNSNQIDQYISFIQALKNELSSENLIYVKFPISFVQQPSYTKLFQDLIENKIVDYFILQNYSLSKQNFIYKNDENFSPVSIINRKNDINKLIFQIESLNIPKNKVILEIPGFGQEWKEHPNLFYEQSSNFFRPLKEIIKKEKGELIDSSYIKEKISDGKTIYIYENKFLMQQKLQWVKDTQLGGVGIWGLSYANDTKKSFWNAVAEVYSSTQQNFWFVVIGMLLMGVFIGYPLSIYKYWQVRSALAFNIEYLWGMLAIGLLILFFALLFLNIIPHQTVNGLILDGIALGLIATRIFRKYLAKAKKIFKYLFPK